VLEHSQARVIGRSNTYLDRNCQFMTHVSNERLPRNQLFRPIEDFHFHLLARFSYQLQRDFKSILSSHLRTTQPQHRPLLLPQTSIFIRPSPSASASSTSEDGLNTLMHILPKISERIQFGLELTTTEFESILLGPKSEHTINELWRLKCSISGARIAFLDYERPPPGDDAI
jgi:hypothetical protein